MCELNKLTEHKRKISSVFTEPNRQKKKILIEKHHWWVGGTNKVTSPAKIISTCTGISA